MARLGPTTVHQLERLITAGAIANCDVQLSDLRTYREVHSAHEAELKGHSVAQPPRVATIDRLTNAATFTERDIVLYGDIMRALGRDHLTCVSSRIGATTTVSLKDTKAASIIEAVRMTVNLSSSEGWRVKTLSFDRQTGLENSTSAFHAMGIRLNLSAAGGHVPVVESKIRQIKDNIRSVIGTVACVGGCQA